MNEMIESGMEGEEKAEYCRKKYKAGIFCKRRSKW